eukprot:NODE_97_length_20652_cov_0.832093.p17 type:complete len:112 gc:universal NODE_97_length_20652_cov_0.832093:537-872(+)
MFNVCILERYSNDEISTVPFNFNPLQFIPNTAFVIFSHLTPAALQQLEDTCLKSKGLEAFIFKFCANVLTYWQSVSCIIPALSQVPGIIAVWDKDSGLAPIIPFILPRIFC